MTTKELTRRKNPNGIGFIENNDQWCSRIAAALVPGTFFITPRTYWDEMHPVTKKVRETVGGNAIFCPRCAEGLNWTDYASCEVTDDDAYYCENCEEDGAQHSR